MAGGPFWLPEEEAFLREHAGRLTVPELRARLWREFKVERSENAIRIRMQRLGCGSTLFVGYTLKHAGEILGLVPRRVRDLILAGVLAGHQLHPGQRYSEWIVTEHALEQFIRTQRGYYRRERLRGKWRQLAELVNARDPLLTREETARILGCSLYALGLYMRRGQLAAFKVPRSGGGVRENRFLRSAVLAFRHDRRQARQARRQRVVRLHQQREQLRAELVVGDEQVA
jgi:hypothetical protein